MLTKTDVYNIANMSSTGDVVGFSKSSYLVQDLMEVVRIMEQKIWSECGETLSNFLMPSYPLQIEPIAIGDQSYPDTVELNQDLSLTDKVALNSEYGKFGVAFPNDTSKPTLNTRSWPTIDFRAAL